MSARIDDKLARAIEVPKAGQRIVYDGGHDKSVPGFGVRVTQAGARAYVLNYRVNGIERRKTIGSVNDWTAAAARQEASRLRREVDTGSDPLERERAERVRTMTLRGLPTIDDLCDRYEREHLPGKRPESVRGDKAMIKSYIKPELGKKKIADVGHGDVKALHQRITRAGKPTRANRVLALLSKMFSLAMLPLEGETRPWRTQAEGNPCKGVQRNSEERRDRYLTLEEIGRLLPALQRYPGKVSAACITFLLLTGARLGEATHATWSQIDMAAGTWTKPSAHTKQKKAHHVPLSGPALQVIQAIRPEDAKPDDPVFPGRDGKSGIVQLRSCWQAVTKAAGIGDARIHDLRHTYASLLVSSGKTLALIGALLGHTQAATTQRYAHLMTDPLKEATNTVGSLIAGGQPAEIVSLRKGGAA